MMSGPTNSGSEMSNPELFQKMALLSWLGSQSEGDRETLSTLVGVQVARELLNRITGQSKIDAYKSECIRGIASYVQENPRASQAQINAEAVKHVLQFAARVKALDEAPIF